MPEIAGKEYSNIHWGWNLKCIIPRICRTSFFSLNVNKLINLTLYSMVFVVWRVKMRVSLLVYIVTVFLFLMHRNILLYKVWWNIIITPCSKFHIPGTKFYCYETDKSWIWLQRKPNTNVTCRTPGNKKCWTKLVHISGVHMP